MEAASHGAVVRVGVQPGEQGGKVCAIGCGIGGAAGS